MPMDRETLPQRILEKIPRLRLIDDEFMSVCFDGNIEAAQLVLRIILNRNDIVVTEVHTQHSMKNLLGHDLRLDILAVDGQGLRMNIEIQRSSHGAGRRRARYHASMLDASLLKAGDSFDNLPEVYVISITETDVLGRGEPLYVIERQITCTGEAFDDGEHIVYVNGACREGMSAIARLMQDFFNPNPNTMNYATLARRAKYYKETEKGVVRMSEIMEELALDIRKEAEDESIRKFAIKLIDFGMPLEQIAALTDLNLAQVEEIASQMQY